MTDTIERIEIRTVRIPRDTPYLGPLGDDIRVTPGGYFVRPGNSSVYSVHDQSVLVRVVSRDGVEGWGEAVGFVSPDTAATVLHDVIAPFVIGRDAENPAAVYEALYDAMRVRGFFGGFYGDALAAMDIALWDLKGRSTGRPLSHLLGGHRRSTVPAYVSGLPAASRGERADLAAKWVSEGFDAVKFAAAVAGDGEVAEIASIRETVGPGVRILADLHWRYTSAEAIALITRLEEHDLYLAEAPVAPEDVEGQARVAASVRTPIGLGEELRTVFEFLPRFERRSMGVIQPEMGRTGVTSFWQILQLARAFHVRLMPHASIGIGLFQAASLHLSAAFDDVPYHEYQHSVFDRNLQFLHGDMACAHGMFTVPTGPGLGVSPTAEVLGFTVVERTVA